MGETVVRFASAYGRRGTPRIAVYWNHEVDDRIGQWVAERRDVGGQVEARDRGERVFRDAFLAPLSRARVRVVDRATIVRLTALVPGAQAVEMAALRGYADVFVEILAGSPGKPGDRLDVRIVATEVKTGLVLAQLHSRTLLGMPGPSRVYAATPRGFVPREIPPPLGDIATHLVLRLMDALADRWSA